MAVVLGGAFLLLLLVFRSILIGVKAVVMNLLTIGATFGVLVAVFQWGWLSSQIGMTMEVDIVSFVPLLVFAIVFGLSMDYEVFLMSGMQEAYLESDDPREAVSHALGTTGRVIISAALVMFAVFVSFVSNPSPMVKQIGLGLAVGVLVDALVVRLLLVPAVMRLLGPGRVVDAALAGPHPAEDEHRGRVRRRARRRRRGRSRGGGGRGSRRRRPGADGACVGLSPAPRSAAGVRQHPSVEVAGEEGVELAGHAGRADLALGPDGLGEEASRSSSSAQPASMTRRVTWLGVRAASRRR